MLTESSLDSLLTKQNNLTKICLTKCLSVSFRSAYRLVKSYSKLECLELSIDHDGSENDSEDEWIFVLSLLSSKIKDIILNYPLETSLKKHLIIVERKNRARNHCIEAFSCTNVPIEWMRIYIDTYRSLTSLALLPETHSSNHDWWLKLSDADLQTVFQNLVSYLFAFQNNNTVMILETKMRYFPFGIDIFASKIFPEIITQQMFDVEIIRTVLILFCRLI